MPCRSRTRRGHCVPGALTTAESVKIDAISKVAAGRPRSTASQVSAGVLRTVTMAMVNAMKLSTLRTTRP